MDLDEQRSGAFRPGNCVLSRNPYPQISNYSLGVKPFFRSVQTSRDVLHAYALAKRFPISPYLQRGCCGGPPPAHRASACEDQDGRLTFPEFVALVHTITCRTRGLPLHPEGPHPELAASVAELHAVSPGEPRRWVRLLRGFSMRCSYEHEQCLCASLRSWTPEP